MKLPPVATLLILSAATIAQSAPAPAQLCESAIEPTSAKFLQRRLTVERRSRRPMMRRSDRSRSRSTRSGCRTRSLTPRYGAGRDAATSAVVGIRRVPEAVPGRRGVRASGVPGAY